MVILLIIITLILSFWTIVGIAFLYKALVDYRRSIGYYR